MVSSHVDGVLAKHFQDGCHYPNHSHKDTVQPVVTTTDYGWWPWLAFLLGIAVGLIVVFV